LTLFESIGAERLVQHLHKNKVPIAVATSSGKESVAVKTKNFQDLFGLFPHIVMGSSDPEVKNGKPAPDIFQVCANRFPDKPSYDKVSGSLLLEICYRVGPTSRFLYEMNHEKSQRKKVGGASSELYAAV